MPIFHVGVDCTDSATLGMCTTYLGARLLEVIHERGFELVGPPALVRLNPNVPWKTRGNGAVYVRCRGSADQEEQLFDAARELVEALSVFDDPQTNPGLAIVKGEGFPGLERLYHRSLHEIVAVEDALVAGAEANARVHGWKNRRGLIGALAAIGFDREPGFTWEVIAYREASRYGTVRQVDAASVAAASRRHPSTFFNVDAEGALLCVPRSPCPVLYGIRGTDPEETRAAAMEVLAEAVERWVLWETNQHTDAHIEPLACWARARPYSSVVLETEIVSRPGYRQGGHLYVTVRDREGGELSAVAYRQTLGFREQLAGLHPGDRVTLWGAVRPADGEHPMVLNLEKLRVEHLVEVFEDANPVCPRCGGRMESMGAGQGKRCKKCRLRRRHAGKDRVRVERDLSLGFIEPHPSAWRHLYRPCYLPPRGTSPIPTPCWGRGLSR